MNESDQRFEMLKARYAASLPHKRQVLAATWQAFSAAPADAEPQADLVRQIHQLCGSAPGYGYAQIGACARIVDGLLREPAAASPAALATAVQGLLEALAVAEADLAGQTAPAADVALHVLLVEDDPAQARLLAAQLEARGCTVRQEDRGDLLWQTLTVWPCHAVVLDYWLRGETAAELAATLRREPRFASLAMVCFSVERDARILRGALDAGCDATVRKDEGVQRLYDVLRDCVARTDRSGILFG